MTSYSSEKEEEKRREKKEKIWRENYMPLASWKQKKIENSVKSSMQAISAKQWRINAEENLR